MLKYVALSTETNILVLFEKSGIPDPDIRQSKPIRKPTRIQLDSTRT